MTIKVGINGYGRIGRNVLRALYESGKNTEIEIVAVNDLGDANTNAHLTRRDTAHGPFPGTVEVDGDYMIVNGDRIRVLAERDPSNLPWGDLGVDIVLESTGFFTTRDTAGKHLEAGAKKVVISAPGGADIDATIVYGVNHDVLKAGDTIISNASCTTNCLAPLVKPLRRARSATMSQIPTKTGAAAAVGLVLPELNGRLDGFSMRVPTINVSAVDLSFVASRETSIEEINAVMKEASEGDLKGVLAYNDEPLVSIDFNHDPASSTYDAGLTKVMQGTLVKVCAWYDNEWGFSNRMLDTTIAFHNVG